MLQACILVHLLSFGYTVSPTEGARCLRMIGLSNWISISSLFHRSDNGTLSELARSHLVHLSSDARSIHTLQHVATHVADDLVH